MPLKETSWICREALLCPGRVCSRAVGLDYDEKNKRYDDGKQVGSQAQSYKCLGWRQQFRGASNLQRGEGERERASEWSGRASISLAIKLIAKADCKFHPTIEHTHTQSLTQSSAYILPLLFHLAQKCHPIRYYYSSCRRFRGCCCSQMCEWTWWLEWATRFGASLWPLPLSWIVIALASFARNC